MLSRPKGMGSISYPRPLHQHPCTQRGRQHVELRFGYRNSDRSSSRYLAAANVTAKENADLSHLPHWNLVGDTG